MTQSSTRQELAAAAGVSVKTFSRWLEDIMPQLQNLGYRPRSKLFTPAQTEFICQHYCIDMKNRPP